MGAVSKASSDLPSASVHAGHTVSATYRQREIRRVDVCLEVVRLYFLLCAVGSDVLCYVGPIPQAKRLTRRYEEKFPVKHELVSEGRFKRIHTRTLSPPLLQHRIAQAKAFLSTYSSAPQSSVKMGYACWV